MPNSTSRGTVWSVTINNPVAADEENVSLARQRGWKVDGQLERGDNGTPHYQLVVKTPQVRFSQVKKAFPRAHIEPARNPVALDQYVHKDDTRVAELASQTELYPSLSRFWDLIYDQIQQDWQGPAEWAPNEYYSLTAFDRYVNRLIQSRYHVETMAVNPQIRGCFQRFGHSLMIRSSVDRQRQTDGTNVAEVSIPVQDAIQEENEPSSPPSDDAP